MVRRLGHRGAAGYVAENTIASFERAIELGCDEIETDVWSDRDRLVISHDPPGDAPASLTLAEALDHCRGRVGVNVEIKARRDVGQARRTAREVAQLLRDRADADVYVSSFWWPALEEAAIVAPEVRRAYIFASYPPLEGGLIDAATGHALWAMHPARAYVTPELVRAAHAAGLVVNAWTVNDPAEIAAVIAAGVDGIFSDYPDRIPRGES